MAFFLGTESCIDSLRCDLNDIQDTIDEILVRCGPVKCYSWKSPDKLACDLDIKELLDRFQFGKDEVDNQFTHYSLLELIIDRLLLLIYLSTQFVDTSLTSDSELSRKLPLSKSTQISAGLAVKKYWNKFTQLLSTVRQLNCQNKAQQAKQKDDLRESQQNLAQLKATLNNQQQQQQSQSSTRTISNEVSSKSCQTNETSFVPCEACAKIQTNLKQNADLMINMCHYQNIQSQVGKHRASLMATQLTSGWLSGADLDKWLSEQDKDLSKISKQLEYLSKNNELLKNKIVDNEAQIQKMQETEKEVRKMLKEEQESQSITMKQYEKKLSDQKTDLSTKIKNLETENKTLLDLKTSLDQKYDNLKNLHENNEKIITELSQSNKLITDELKLKTDQKEKLKKLEEELTTTKSELDNLKKEIIEKTNELNLEKAKLDNSIKNEHSLRLKHEALLESLDKLTAENESLLKRTKSFDEEKRVFMDTIKTKQDKIESIETEKELLNKSIEEFKSQLKKYKDNELLLLKYPDLYGPIEINESEINVAEDMQNQINANKHRINLLDNLNNKLINSIKKLNEKRNSIDHQTSKLEPTGDENENYFMKHKDSRRESLELVETPKKPTTPKQQVLARPVPLFKLENELDETPTKPNEKYWIPDESTLANSKPNLVEHLKRESSSLNKKINSKFDYANDSDSDENEYDFFKDKRESDQNYLSKLNQINLNSELKIENTDFSMYKNRRSSRNHEGSFMHSPSSSSLNSERANSKMSTRSQIRQTPIPPPDKNMEVVVGKGRRSSMSKESARPSSSNKPPSGRNPSAKTKTNLVCENCNKKYENSKDMDIHKMYCTN